jgi:hypothetical protein
MAVLENMIEHYEGIIISLWVFVIGRKLNDLPYLIDKISKPNFVC